MLDEYFEIQLDNDKLKATLLQKVRINENSVITENDILGFIMEHGIVFGIKKEFLTKIAANEITCPVVIAEGLSPINGKDAILKPILPNDNEIKSVKDLHNVDLKQVINIPSVTHGQLIGEKITATSGTAGMNVFGEELLPKPGKDFRLRVGKNTRIDDEGLRLFSMIDGQMSIENKVIHVYPVYEVNGDLDLKVGNISFIGSVIIRGNVPAGFEIKSKGDIKIHGTVENAILLSEGSIFVSTGIVGQGKGLIKAKGDLHTSFINQGIVEVEGDVHVTQSILHSKIMANGSVFCQKGKGNIVGGDISAGKRIVAKEVGNAHNTRTTLYLGVQQEIMEKEKVYTNNLKKAEDDLNKLTILLEKLTEKEIKSSLSTIEKITKLRVRNTINSTTELMLEAKEKLEELEDLFSSEEESSVIVEQQIYPNVDLHFGKYRRKIITVFKSVKVHIDNGEIVVTHV
ncbi:hypothetical protein BKP37_11570 [Anaerobacillus alkalilacustris]|uniref:Flagellar Assembly Protein A N-terminal region domain-containing protein n=1 Tax=Anaerobacillus alkalilacustris TaxID=393763 RepID=A0A1S2LKU3_9BACI|nr:FapA family protein [Anaerobacillus alkalilacustris]OIJ13139.1 hypothetical protein BKP37_11570 [Anaerobacillus alkalilacustris]